MKFSKTQECAIKAIYEGGGEVFSLPGTGYWSSERGGPPIAIENSRWAKPGQPGRLTIGTIIPLEKKGILVDLLGKKNKPTWNLHLRLTSLGREEALKLLNKIEDSVDGMGDEIHVATSPLTNTIYAGIILKDGQTWGPGKRDVTGEACAAVAQHVLANKEPVIVSSDGKPLYEIIVRDLSR